MKIALFWHRRDLRFHDNTGLAAALRSGLPVLPLFIYDSDILEKLPERADARLTFIYDEVERLAKEAQAAGGGLIARYGKPLDVFRQLLTDYEIGAVFTNEDYEPYATRRDGEVGALLQEQGIQFSLLKDQVIFAKSEVLTKNGNPHKVFGSYRTAWMDKLTDNDLADRGSLALLKAENLARPGPADKQRPTLENMGFERRTQHVPTQDLPQEEVVRNYHRTRNLPAITNGTTRTSVQLRFGTLSVRQLMWQAKELNPKLLAELIWRDFFMMLLWHFPNTASEAYDSKMRAIRYRNDPDEFRAWAEGRTGYPLVDAGMRELNATGYLPNRARIAAAGFLVKHLFTDWRLGEQYFADKLLDYDQSNNVGNWQWMAGTGAVSAPWFRVYSPANQQEQYDPEYKYVKEWVPEFGTDQYVPPIVDHKFARERAVTALRAGIAEARL